MPVALVVSDPTNVVGHSSSFVFNVPKGPPTVASVAVWVRAYESLIAQHGRISVMVVIRPKSSSRVTPEARDAIAKMANRLGPNIIGQATVVDAAGIYGTIVRTFMTGLNLISKTPAPTKVFRAIEPALEWLETLPGQTPTFPLLKREVAQHIAASRDSSVAS